MIKILVAAVIFTAGIFLGEAASTNRQVAEKPKVVDQYTMYDLRKMGKWKDPETGCWYLTDVGTGLTPRYTKEGKHWCE